MIICAFAVVLCCMASCDALNCKVFGNHSYTTEIIEPTCTEKGYTTYTCKCGDSYVSDYVYAIGHVESDWIVDKEATVSEDGQKHTECTKCKMNMSMEVIPATGSIGLEYTNYGEFYVVSGIGTCTDTDIIIASEYNGLPVTQIGVKAFKDCTLLINITIPDSVTCIMDDAFSGCESLTSISISNSVTSIWFNAFSGCTSLTSITIPDSVMRVDYDVFDGCTSLIYNEYDNALYLGNESNPYHILVQAKDTNITSCDIHNATKIIYSEAFKDCTLLINIAIPNSVTSIGDYAFSGCDSLTSITIPNSVTSIGLMVFEDCKSLISVTIPDSVTSVGDYAFHGCTSLKNIEVDGENEYYKSIDGNLYSKDGTMLIQYAVGKQDTSFTIPDSVTSIAKNAFFKCISLTSIIIPGSVTSIGDYAFSGCDSLTSITIPNAVTSIGNNAFSSCDSLTNITIPDSVTSIGYSAFYACISLESIIFEGTVKQWNAIDFDSHWNSYVPATEVVCSDGTVSLK